MLEQDQKYAVTLASMVYDIGKFAWQAEIGDDDYKKFSQKFFNENIAHKNCVKPIANYVNEVLISKNNKKFQMILEAEDIFLKSENAEKNKLSRKPLASVFSKIKIKTTPIGKFIYQPRVLNIDDVFPEEIKENWDVTEYKRKIRKLYDDFVDEIALIPDLELSSFINSLLFLMEKYLVYVNSSIGENNSDISLFDHIKTITALSICKEFSENEELPFLIVVADVSGIQDFIYAEKKNKSKRLRGRSFYLGLLTDIFSSYLLNKFDLPRTNILMNGGGHFVMIVPNNKKNKKILHFEQQQIEKWFYSKYKGELNLVIASLEASDELYKNFTKWYNEITGLLIAAKKHKSIDFLEKTFSYDLDRADFSEYYSLLTKEQKEKVNSESTEYERNQKILDVLFEQIGSNLPRTKFLIEIAGKHDELINLVKENKDLISLPFFEFGIVYVFAENPSGFIARNKDVSFNAIKVLKINDTNYSNEIKKDANSLVSSNSPYSFGFTFMGNYAPTDINNSILEFEKLAASNKEDDKELKYLLLATLRMDVDNLGAIFSQGLEREEGQSVRTLSRTVSLSREFNLFFGGYLNKIAKKWDVYITYSGGDDLFVVASWINAINFAVEVKNKFSEFACKNEDVTISGGLFIHKHNFPIGRAAEQAGEAETKAKHRKETGKLFEPKNGLTIFDKAFSWDLFIKHLDYGKKLDRLIEGKKEHNPEKIKSSYLHFLLQRSKEMFNDEDEFQLDNYFKVISKIKYYLARGERGIKSEEIEKSKRGEQVSEKTQLLAKLINDKKYLENLIISASYVVLKNRD